MSQKQFLAHAASELHIQQHDQHRTDILQCLHVGSGEFEGPLHRQRVEGGHSLTLYLQVQPGQEDKLTGSKTSTTCVFMRLCQPCITEWEKERKNYIKQSNSVLHAAHETSICFMK